MEWMDRILRSKKTFDLASILLNLNKSIQFLFYQLQSKYVKTKEHFNVLTTATADGLKSNTNTNLYLLARKVTFVEGRILQIASSVSPSSDSLRPHCIDWTARMCNSSFVHTLTKYV